MTPPDEPAKPKPAAKPGTAAQSRPAVPAKPATTTVAKPGTVVPAPAKPATTTVDKAAGLKPATSSLAKSGEAKPVIGESAAAATPLQAAGKVDYAFEDSDEPPKPKKAYVPPPVEAAPPPRDEDEDPLAEDKPAARAPARPATGKVAKPGTGRVAAPPAAPDRPAPAVPDKPVPATPDATGDDNDPDLKPGSRKDLWKCPHCGTGNRPGREDCRKCGKRPDDEVAIPWTAKPQSWAVIGVVALVLILAMFWMMRSDLSLHPADVGHVDGNVRIGGHPASVGPTQIEGKSFIAQRQLSVVGRCLDSAAYPDIPGLVTVVVLLGSAARSDQGMQTKVNFNGQRTDIEDAASGSTAVFHLFPADGVDKPVLTKGYYVSFVGDLGDLDGVTDGYSVRVRQFQSNPP